MAKKILCVVLSVMMLMGTLVFASSAAQYDNYNYTVEEAEEEVASKWWYDDYDSSVDYKDLINRKFLTGSKDEGYITPTVAADEEILQRNIYFWADEIIAAYNDPNATNEDYCDLYNKMRTPSIATYVYEENGETVVEADILYEYGYFYREESKAVVDIELVADKTYAKPGDIVTVDVYVTSNFLTMQFFGGFFYDKTCLEALSVDFDEASQPTWKVNAEQTELALVYNPDGTVKLDRRPNFWPRSMREDPANYDKYAVAHVFAQADVLLGEGLYQYARQFDGSRMYTVQFKVKDDVPEGTVLELFAPSDANSLMTRDLLEQEHGDREAVFKFMRMSIPGGTYPTNSIMPDPNCKYDTTVNLEPISITIGEEPEEAVMGEVVSAKAEPGTIGENVPVDVTVTGSPDAIRLVAADDSATTYTRDDATIVATDAGEVWTVDVFADEEEATYAVYASYGDLGWTEDAVEVTVTATVAIDLSVHSIEIPDMYPDAQNGGVIKAGKHDVIIKTSTDVTKVQFYAEDGTSYTYGTHAADAVNPYEDINGERVWTISHNFGPYGTRSLVVRTRTYTTFFAATDSTLDATVVY